MAFGHINLDASGSPPGRNDACPCGSGKKTKNCCTVDRWRLVPRRGRRPGVVPADLAVRVERLTGDFSVRFLARSFLPARLGGLAPAALSDGERAELRELFDGQRDQVDEALEILERGGYGQPRGRRPRPERAHGQIRARRLERVVGKLPRALAVRLPTSADTHRSGPNDGSDVYGEVECSQTLRAMHLGLLAAAGGLWHSRNPAGHEYAASTAGELAQLVGGRRRLGGKDIAAVHRALSELEQLALHATVNTPSDGGDPRDDLQIPGPPVARVERLLPDGRWVNQAEYAAAVGELAGEQQLAAAQQDLAEAGGETVRIYLAPWVREQIANGRPTLINFEVWAHLRPTAQRLYAALQASSRDGYDDAIRFYLGKPWRYTVGLRGRQHRAAAIIRAALNQIYHADVRYNASEKWSVEAAWAKTKLPAFRLRPSRRASAPTERALARRKCPGERPAKLRRLTLAQAGEQVALVRQALADATPQTRQAAPSRVSAVDPSAGGPQPTGP
ncbi:MAG: SEC-C metal-binding domain-containing protein [Solirubrobacteraceae bacterium]